jgi:hypothetical protein
MKRSPKRKNERAIVTSAPAFKILKERLSIVTVNGQLKINNTYDEFLEIVRLLLRSVPVDETWYLAEYPDVAEAIAAGEIKSAKLHFIDSGYFEGRLPSPLEVDEAWYLAEYPDVAEGIARGELQSAKQHFIDHGYEEGRMPSAQ